METTKVSNKRDDLVSQIVETFNAREDFKRFQNICKKYPLTLVLRAYAEAKSIPQSRIRKSRSALFFYLLKKYAHERKSYPRH